MINLVDLYYQINKDIFFTDKITNEAFSIYYNHELPEVMWNYAAISNLSSVQKNYDEICKVFTGINKKIGFYLREDQKNDICKLLEHQIIIKYPESWLRYEGNDFTTPYQAQKVSSQSEQEEFIKFFAELNKKYYQSIEAFLNVFKKTFSSKNFEHYALYHEKRVIGIAVLGIYKDYALISHLQTFADFSDIEHQAALLKACWQAFNHKHGKELYLQIIDNPLLEKKAIKQGFNKMFNAYLMSR